MLQYRTKLRDDGTLEIYVDNKLFTKIPEFKGMSKDEIAKAVSEIDGKITARQLFSQKNNYAEFEGDIFVPNGLITVSDTMINDEPRIKDIKIAKGIYGCYTIYHFKKHRSKIDCCIVLKDDAETYEKIKNNKSWREYDKTQTIDVQSGFVGFLVNCDNISREEWRNLARNPLLKRFCVNHNDEMCFGTTVMPNYGHNPANMRHLYVIRNKNKEITALKIKE